MIGLLQRVLQAQVEVDGAVVGRIDHGLLVLIGVEREDTRADADRLLERLLGYRVFADNEDKMNLSVRDVAGGLLLVPQFTLPADTRKGMRPSFTPAAPPEQGRALFEYLTSIAAAAHPTVSTGVFGADMRVSLTNDGPVTFLVADPPELSLAVFSDIHYPYEFTGNSCGVVTPLSFNPRPAARAQSSKECGHSAAMYEHNSYKQPRAEKMSQASLRTPAAPANSQTADEPILVFESNLAGQHGKGTSFLAEKCHGAVMGKGWGLQGSSYAIPGFDKDLIPVSATVLTNYVQSFLKHAAGTPQQRYRVTALGFGNPNISQAELVKMFARAPSNCLLPGRWLELQGKLESVRIIVLDAAAALRSEKVQQRLDDYFSINAPLWTNKSIEIVSTGSPQSVMANDQYARSRKYRHRIVNVNETFYRNYINQAREDMAVWYGTRILNIAEPDQTSQGSTLRILQSAIRGGLEIEDITLGEQF